MKVRPNRRSRTNILINDPLVRLRCRDLPYSESSTLHERHDCQVNRHLLLLRPLTTHYNTVEHRPTSALSMVGTENSDALLEFQGKAVRYRTNTALGYLTIAPLP